jgi:hypothetical protein
MRRFVITVVVCMSCLLVAHAQTTFTERLQQSNGSEGKVTVTQSKAIDDLVNGVSTGQKSEANQKPHGTSDTKPDHKSNALSPTEHHRAEPRQDTISASTLEPLPVEPRKKVMRNSYKVNGFRVQAYAGGNQRKDRQTAERVAGNIKAHFPDEPVYTHFYSPRWICRVGNYRTYEEAHEMLLNIRKLGYSSATIVKGKITVQYLNESGN